MVLLGEENIILGVRDHVTRASRPKFGQARTSKRDPSGAGPLSTHLVF